MGTEASWGQKLQHSIKNIYLYFTITHVRPLREDIESTVSSFRHFIALVKQQGPSKTDLSMLA